MPAIGYEKEVVPQHKTHDSNVYTKDDVLYNTLKEHIDGTNWVVTYYNSIVGDVDSVVNFDFSNSDVFTQYIKIEKFIIKTQSNMDVDVATTLTGSGTIIADIRVNKGDMFLTTMLGQRSALFIITSYKQKTYNMEQVIDVEYKLYTFLDEKNKLIDVINSKIISEKTYYSGKNQIEVIDTVEYDVINTSKDLLKEITDYYLDTVLDKNLGVFRIPSTKKVVTDFHLADFLKKILPYDVLGDVEMMFKSKAKRTIWEILLTKNKSMLPRANIRQYIYQLNNFANMRDSEASAYNSYNSYRITGLTPTYEKYPLLDTLKYSGIDYVIDYQPLTGDDICENARDILMSVKSGQGLIPEITIDIDIRIFSRKFITGTTDYNSKLEDLIMNYLNNEQLNVSDIMLVGEKYESLDPIEQFYYIPILIFLLKGV
jgi:hypothetical protein